MHKERNEGDKILQPEIESGQAESQGESRRKFIIKGIAAAPIILTVSSRPVWAYWCGLSGQYSGNQSQPYEPCGGQGCSPGGFKNHIPDWWHPAIPPETPFGLGIDTPYGPIPSVTDPFLNAPTMEQVIVAKQKDLGDTLFIDPEYLEDCVLSVKLSASKKPEDYCSNQILSAAQHFVAAIQNAALDSVSYERTLDQVIMDWNAIFSGNIKDNLDNFIMFYEELHELDCPLTLRSR